MDTDAQQCPGLCRALHAYVCVCVFACRRVLCKGQGGAPTLLLPPCVPMAALPWEMPPNLLQAAVGSWRGYNRLHVSHSAPFKPLPKVLGTSHLSPQWAMARLAHSPDPWLASTMSPAWVGGHDSPLGIHSGEGEGHPFEQQHHEDPLAEGAVAHALPILARLWAEGELSCPFTPGQLQWGQHRAGGAGGCR